MSLLKNLFTKYRSQILYIIFGVSSTIVNIAVYAFLRWVNAPYQVAYWGAWFFAVLFAYLTNRVAVFNSSASGFKELAIEVLKFYVARIVTGLLGSAIMAFGVSILHQNDFIWNMIQNVFVIVSNYALGSLVVFRQKEKMSKD